jgi:uncharacterized protein
MQAEHLPFWQFFHAIEKELSYERWIDKYLLLLKMLRENYVEYDADWAAFKKLCRALYLQDVRDADRFNQLLDKAIETEKQFMETWVRNISLEAQVANPSATNKAAAADTAEKKPEIPAAPAVDNTQDEDETVTTNEPMDLQGSKTLYYEPPVIESETGVKALTKPTNFLMTDEYFPVTRRQMIKGWQFLRYQEKGGFTNEIDIPATVQKIGREGLFTGPILKQGVRNREDTLIIFADYRGSMMPFHELTNRLIETARKEGGHPRAPVFYFQNYPTGYVYRTANFSGPLKVKEALVKANRNSTLAIVISDAGAARGNGDRERQVQRNKMTGVFLNALDEACAHTIWLNPMPAHRWPGTSAELVSKSVFLMTPVIDNYTYSFQDTLRTILRHTKEQF